MGQGVLNDPAAHDTQQVDVAIAGVAGSQHGETPLLAIGEAKWGETMGRRHLDRLRRIRGLIDAHGKYDTSATRILCFSSAGFTDGLREGASASPDILLISAEDLYGQI